jgi:polysaccharide export outer membrane protein
VSESGKINHPYLGEVELDNLTRSAAELKLKTLLERDLLQPGRASVTLDVEESRARSIHIIGAVEKPTQLSSARRWTLLEAITEAGGLSQDSGRRAFIIRRSANGLTAQIDIDLDDLLFRADPRVNLPLMPEDVINIPQAIEVTIYCLGEVNEPGAIAFRSSDEMTLVAAISRAGGLTDRAKRRIRIKRRGAGNLIEEIEVNFKDILEGRRPDLVLEPGDVVQVGMSFL